MDVGVIPHHQRWSIFWDFNIFKKNCAVLHFKPKLLKQSGAKNKSRADGSILWLRGVCYYLRKTCHFVQNTQNTIINPGMFFVLFLWFNLVPPQPKCQTPYSLLTILHIIINPTLYFPNCRRTTISWPTISACSFSAIIAMTTFDYSGTMMLTSYEELLFFLCIFVMITHERKKFFRWKTTKKELKERKIFDVLQNHYYLMWPKYKNDLS